MIRVIFFLLVVAGLALGAAWLAERPGDIAVTWMGWRIETSLMVGFSALLVLVVLLMALWWLLRLIWRSPHLLGEMRRDRQRRRGQRALSRGLLAVASGDIRGAKRSAGEAGRFATEEPLTLLLQAQTAQLSGDRNEADAAFRAMTERAETRLLGLRGLYVEAQRRGDAEAGRRFAEEAARRAPALPWAGQAVFDFRCASGDWEGALATLESNLRSGLIDKAAYRRQRAVLLTAHALSIEEQDADAAKTLALDATRIAPGLVPAASLAGRLSAEAGEYRRAAKVIETAWPLSPHPDLAEIYIHLRSGESARERLARAQALERLHPGSREGGLALAKAAIEAHDFTTAHAALAPHLERLTPRAAMLMAELEEAEHENSPRAREWMTRALRAAGDPRWVADGMVSDRWLPVSPVSGRLDAFSWMVPAGESAVPGPLLEDHQTRSATLALPSAEARADAAETTDVAPSAKDMAPSAKENGERPVLVPPDVAKPKPAATPASIMPMMHAPDDPGPEPDDHRR